MSNTILDKITEDFSPVKTLLFFLAFTAVFLFVIFIFIVPSIKNYKKIKTQHFRYEMSINRSKDLLLNKENKLHKLTKENKRILNALIAHFDKNRFIEYSNNFFSDVKLVKLSNQENKADKAGFLVYELNVTSSIKSPSNFYNFLNGLSRYESIIKADFPIILQSQGDTIKSSFKIKVYNAK